MIEQLLGVVRTTLDLAMQNIRMTKGSERYTFLVTALSRNFPLSLDAAAQTKLVYSR